jgi:hypothetical protein
LLGTFTRDDASKTGRSLSAILLGSISAESAVDEWVRSTTALGELEAEFEWMRPVFDAIITDILATATFGAKFRAYFGASVSMMDMVSDIYVMSSFFEEGRQAFAWSLLGMILANIVLQLMIVYIVTLGMKEDRWESLTSDTLYVVTCIKPGVRLNPLLTLRIH